MPAKRTCGHIQVKHPSQQPRLTEGINVGFKKLYIDLGMLLSS